MSTKAQRGRIPNYPAYIDRPKRGQTRAFSIHKHNPAGSKLVRGFYRSKHGLRDTFEKATLWYGHLT